MPVRNQDLQRGGGPVIIGDCLILTSPPLREVNDSILTMTVCTVNDNGTLMIGDEETEVLLFFTATNLPLKKGKVS